MQLLGHLIDRLHSTVQCERDAGDRLVIRRAYGQRVDVEPAAREQARNPCQDTGLVLDQDREDVLAACAEAASASSSSRDRISLVAGSPMLISP